MRGLKKVTEASQGLQEVRVDRQRVQLRDRSRKPRLGGKGERKVTGGEERGGGVATWKIPEQDQSETLHKSLPRR